MKTLTIPGSSFTAEYDESSDRAMLRSPASSRRANNEELALIKMVLAKTATTGGSPTPAPKATAKKTSTAPAPKAGA